MLPRPAAEAIAIVSAPTQTTDARAPPRIGGQHHERQRNRDEIRPSTCRGYDLAQRDVAGENAERARSGGPSRLRSRFPRTRPPTIGTSRQPPARQGMRAGRLASRRRSSDLWGSDNKRNALQCQIPVCNRRPGIASAHGDRLASRGSALRDPKPRRSRCHERHHDGCNCASAAVPCQAEARLAPPSKQPCGDA